MNATNLEEAGKQWPTFAAEALRVGFRAVHALPMRVRNDTIGALNLFRNKTGALSEADLRAAQALADVATLSILQDRNHSDPQVPPKQLQQALNTRVLIEQAKGFLAERLNVEMDEAFSLLRAYAQDNQRRMHQVARDVTERKSSANALGNGRLRAQRHRAAGRAGGLTARVDRFLSTPFEAGTGSAPPRRDRHLHLHVADARVERFAMTAGQELHADKVHDRRRHGSLGPDERWGSAGSVEAPRNLPDAQLHHRVCASATASAEHLLAGELVDFPFPW